MRLQLQALLAEHLPAATSSHSVFVFAVPIVLSFLGVGYLGGSTTPFDTHPKTMRFSVVVFLLYCFSYGTQLRLTAAPDRALHAINACSRSMEWFGCMLLASLASIFFSDSVQWVFFVFYAALCLAAPLYTLLQILWKYWFHSTTPTHVAAAGHVDLEATGQPL